MSIYLSDELYLSICHSLASLKIWAQEGLSGSWAYYFFSFQFPGPFLSSPEILYANLTLALEWYYSVLHSRGSFGNVSPKPCLDDNQRNSYLQPDSRYIFTVIWGHTITGWLCNHSSCNVSVASYLDKHSNPFPHISQDHFCWATLQVPYSYFLLASAAMVGSSLM